MAIVPNGWIPAVSNFAIQFNYSTISVAVMLITMTYGSLPTWADSAMTSSVYLGSILGMLLLGFLGDKLGRLPAMALTLVIASVGAIFSAVAPWGNIDSVFASIVCFRFILGVGVGGIYPLSSVFSFENEESNKAVNFVRSKASMRSGRALFFQVPGQVAVYLCALLLSYAPISSEIQWRAILFFGSVPLLLCFDYSAFTDISNAKSNETTNKYTLHLAETFSGLEIAAAEPLFGLKLFGASMAWFLFDVYVCGVIIYSPLIIKAILPNASVQENYLANIVTILITLPAALGSILALQWFSLRTLQCFGFCVACLSFCAVGAVWNRFVDEPLPLFLVFCFTKFAMAVLVPMTTFVMPNVLFSEDVRSTCSGVASASGKLGAFVGTFLFPLVYERFDMAVEMYLCASIALLGLIVTVFCIPEGPEAVGYSRIPEVESREDQLQEAEKQTRENVEKI